MTIKEFKKVEKYKITIGKFLSHYYYINGDNLNKLTHTEFTLMFNIRYLSIFDVKMDEVTSGEVVLVTDRNGFVLAFKNPLIIKLDESTADSFYITNASIDMYEKKELDLTNINFSELTDYELDRLLVICKEEGNEKYKNKVIKELRFRPESKPGMKQNLIEKEKIRELKKQSRSER